MQRLLILMAAAATLAACAPAYDPDEVGTHAWQCEQSGYLVSTADLTGAGLWLFGDDDVLLLQPADEGWKKDDVRFSWTDGQATLNGANGTESCTENRRASVRESAKFRGVDFWGTGNEPPWRLELSATELLLYTGYESTERRFEMGRPEVDVENSTTTYSTDNGDDALDLTIKGGGCADSMTGEFFSTTVEIMLNGERLFGCGTALH